MEIRGYVKHAMEARSGVSQRSGKQWMSREYVLEIPGQFPRHFVFTIFGEDKIKQFALKKDEDVIVEYDVDAHEYNGRWYGSNTAYNVKRPYEQQPQQPAQYNNVPQQTTAAPVQQSGGDDLPF